MYVPEVLANAHREAQATPNIRVFQVLHQPAIIFVVHVLPRLSVVVSWGLHVARCLNELPALILFRTTEQ